MQEQLKQELKNAIEKGEERIKELKDRLETEVYLRSTIQGGAFAGTARNASLERSAPLEQEKKKLEELLTWQREMLKKYD